MYVYIESQPGLFTVGFFGKGGTWNPESDWNTAQDAGSRVHYLNGGTNAPAKVQKLQDQAERRQKGKTGHESQASDGDD